MEKTTLRSLVLLTIITGSIFTFVACSSNQSATTTSGNASVNFQPMTQNSGVKVTTKYVDGTYTVDAPYGTPGGDTGITVTVSVKDDTVQDVNVVGQANGGAAQRYQGFFIGGIKSEVIGKKLDDVKVGVVNGASLTSGAFNEAVKAIIAKKA